MAHKLEKKGNYLIITDTITGFTDEYPAREVLYIDTPLIVRISSLTNSAISRDFEYTSLVDYNGDAFASSAAVINWLRTNTGSDVKAATPYTYAIAEGLLPTHNPLLKFGTRSAVAANSYSTIWEGNTALYNYMTSAQQLKIVSSSSEDGVGGTGALTIRIQGLDGDFNEISEDVTMNGVTTVTTTGSFIRIFRGYVLTSGTALSNVGKITVRNNAATVEQLVITEGDGQTLMTLWTVPANYHAYLINGSFSTNSNKGAIVSFLARQNDGGTLYPFLIKYRSYVFGGENNYPFHIPFAIPEKTDIEVRVTTPSGAGTTSAGSTFELWYEVND